MVLRIGDKVRSWRAMGEAALASIMNRSFSGGTLMSYEFDMTLDSESGKGAYCLR